MRTLPPALQNLDSVPRGEPPSDLPLLSTPIADYLDELHRGGDPTLDELETLYRADALPIVGPVVGGLLRQLAQAIGARDTFVLGGGGGYAALHLARGVGEGGRVVHAERDPERSQRARNALAHAGLLDRVIFEVGDAVEILGTYPGPFDLVFIDIDPDRYPQTLELARPRVRPGGYIIADHVLLRGRVVAEGPRDDDTLAVLRYTRAALAAPDLLTTVLPIGDGLALHLKLSESRRRR